MIAYAKLYLNGQGTASALYGHAATALSVATQPALISYLEEWVNMADRNWNEWGHADPPLTDKEFKDWITEQLYGSLKINAS